MFLDDQLIGGIVTGAGQGGLNVFYDLCIDCPGFYWELRDEPSEWLGEAIRQAHLLKDQILSVFDGTLEYNPERDQIEIEVNEGVRQEKDFYHNSDGMHQSFFQTLFLMGRMIGGILENKENGDTYHLYVLSDPIPPFETLPRFESLHSIHEHLRNSTVTINKTLTK